MIERLEWTAVADGMWRSTDGNYVIIEYTMPEQTPRTTYHLRRTRNSNSDFGVLEGEYYWLRESDGGGNSAEAAANRHAYGMAHSRDVPLDYPAVEIDRFFWPISEGTTRGALAIRRREDGDLVAELVGVIRRDDDNGFEPEPFLEINLSQLGFTAPDGLTNTTVRRPQCPNCGAHDGAPHDDRCERARCMVTGDQRLLCSYFGESRVAGIDALATSSTEEFEEYFKAPLEHDCGRDRWQTSDVES